MLSPILRTYFYFLILGCFLACQPAPSSTTQVETSSLIDPADQYQDLFEAVQMAGLFPDSKTFADCTPLMSKQEILVQYAAQKNQQNFDLNSFVDTHFKTPHAYASGFEADKSKAVTEHIESLWPVLTRKPDTQTVGTLIPLPNPYVVPGGRFGEVYYWDSYFTMLGLQVSPTAQSMIRPMIDNFAFLIDTVGFIPNGNRTYYLGRSQPPFFSLMVRLLSEVEGKEVLGEYYSAMQKEYHFWMEGADSLNDSRTAYRRVVRLSGGELLNRHWDDVPRPRSESYREDVELQEESRRAPEDLFPNLRAGCESGWDFSSRWFRDGMDRGTIRTAELIPVDLNSLLYHLEITLAEAAEVLGDAGAQAGYQTAAKARKTALNAYCWDTQQQMYSDFDFVNGERTKIPTLAMMYPLYFRLADEAQAKASASIITTDFLQPGGVVTTLSQTGEQWDAPNGWAPLQWMTIQGLRNYGYDDTADQIKQRWTDLNIKVYRNTGKLVEKYNVMDLSLEAGGGEYVLQDGFGWTNGVLLRLLSESSK